MKRLSVILILMLIGCAASQQQQTIDNKYHPPTCAPGMTTEGGFWQGETWRCKKEYQKLNKNNAYNKIFQTLIKYNYQILVNDKNNGVIQAALPVIAGRGNAVPLTITLIPGPNNITVVRASLSFSSGVTAAPEDVAKLFCKIYGSI